jgi:hypothetical protein
MRSFSRPFLGFAAICLAAASFVWAWTEPPALQARAAPAQPATNEAGLTEEQMMQFLRKAKVITSKRTSKGVTSPYRLTLTDGTLTHDGLFQPIDQSANSTQLDDGTTEINFRDSYHFNIAAYELAKLVGLGEMMPVTIERNWEGKTGSLAWWLPVKMDEADRLRKKIPVPDPDAWNRQMHKMRVFSELVYDTDRNMTNVLIGEDWKLYMIDFTRAFRLHNTLESAKDLAQCDRRLLEKLRQLNAAELERKTKDHLRKSEIKAVMARRDKIVAYFEQLVAKQGENAVLY